MSKRKRKPRPSPDPELKLCVDCREPSKFTLCNPCFNKRLRDDSESEAD